MHSQLQAVIMWKYKKVKGDSLQWVLRYFEKFFQHLESDGGKADTTST